MNDQWTDQLSAYLDDELTPDERRALEAHLADCAACRTTLDELRAVVASAGHVTDRAPDTDLWPGIAARLDRRMSAPVPFWRRRVTLSLPQAVAAGLAIVLVSVTLAWQLQGRSEPPGDPIAAVLPAAVHVNLADASYDRAVSDLEQVLAEGRDQLDPQTYAAIERNLQAIDRAIADARQALDADPANMYLNDHLAQSRKRKLTLLRRATALAHSEG